MAIDVALNICGKEIEMTYMKNGKSNFAVIEKSDSLRNDVDKLKEILGISRKKIKLNISPYRKDIHINTLEKMPYHFSLMFNKKRIVDEGYYLTSKNAEVYNIDVSYKKMKYEKSILLTIYSIKRDLTDEIVQSLENKKTEVVSIIPKQDALISKIKKENKDVVILYTDYDEKNRKVVNLYVYRDRFLIADRIIFYDLYENIIEEEMERTIKYCSSVYHDFAVQNIYIYDAKWRLGNEKCILNISNHTERNKKSAICEAILDKGGIL